MKLKFGLYNMYIKDNLISINYENSLLYFVTDINTGTILGMDLDYNVAGKIFLEDLLGICNNDYLPVPVSIIAFQKIKNGNKLLSDKKAVYILNEVRNNEKLIAFVNRGIGIAFGEHGLSGVVKTVDFLLHMDYLGDIYRFIVDYWSSHRFLLDISKEIKFLKSYVLPEENISVDESFNTGSVESA